MTMNRISDRSSGSIPRERALAHRARLRTALRHFLDFTKNLFILFLYLFLQVERRGTLTRSSTGDFCGRLARGSRRCISSDSPFPRLVGEARCTHFEIFSRLVYLGLVHRMAADARLASGHMQLLSEDGTFSCPEKSALLASGPGVFCGAPGSSTWSGIGC